LVTVGLVTVLAAAACSGSGADKSTTESAAAPAQQQGLNGQYASGDAKTGTGAKLPVRADVEVRSIVYKGELTVRASRVDEAAAKASTIATGAGGLVAGDNRKDGDGGDANADLVIRVPSAAFSDTFGKLSKVGKELSRGINTEDVTEAVVDLDTRIASQKASVDRTRALLSRAQQISDIVTIEQELARREADLGSLQARKRSLADQVTLSTITLHLIGPAASATADDDSETFLTGLAAGWKAFIATVNGLLVVLGALLPFLVALGIPVAVLVWVLRRRRPRPLAAPPGPLGPLGPPAPAAPDA
jgi:hypothetical protein